MKFYSPESYQPEIQILFEKIKAELKVILPTAKVEHIGSSAIKGAISKGDLDIFVGILKDEFASSILKLKDLGFTPKQGTLRTDSLCMLETANYNKDVAIQLVERRSEFEDFLVFRDRLNSDPNLVDKYNQLKRSAEGLEHDEYRKIKSAFILEVLKCRFD